MGKEGQRDYQWSNSLHRMRPEINGPGIAKLALQLGRQYERYADDYKYVVVDKVRMLLQGMGSRERMLLQRLLPNELLADLRKPE